MTYEELANMQPGAEKEQPIPLTEQNLSAMNEAKREADIIAKKKKLLSSGWS